jgi:hypothetical protein
MGMAEMMQRLLAKMNANQAETDKEEMLAKMDASHKEAETDRKAYCEALNEITRIHRMDTNMESMQERMYANHEKMMARMGALIADMKYSREETMVCQEKMEAHLKGKEEPTSMDMEPEVAQEVPVEDAAVMPVGEPRNRRRDRRNLAAGRRQKKDDRNLDARRCRKQQNFVAAHRWTTRRAQLARRRILFTKKTRDYHASRKNLAVACRGTTRRGKVTQHKLNEGPYESNRREFQAQLEGVKTTAQRGSTPATGGEMTRCAEMARRKELAIGRNHTRDKIERGARRLRARRKRLWTRQEGRTGPKGLSCGSYVASRKSKQWTMRRGRPLPKRKKGPPATRTL